MLSFVTTYTFLIFAGWVFTARHSGLGSRNSICLSVCLSHACFVSKPNIALQIFWYHTSFLTPTAFGGRHSLSVWNLRSKWPTRFEKRRLWQISAYDISTVRDSKKVQLWRIESWPWAFEWGICGVRTLPLSPPNGQKMIFSFLESNNVCYKVSLCENFHRQSCSIAIPHLTVCRYWRKRNPSS